MSGTLVYGLWSTVYDVRIPQTVDYRLQTTDHRPKTTLELQHHSHITSVKSDGMKAHPLVPLRGVVVPIDG